MIYPEIYVGRVVEDKVEEILMEKLDEVDWEERVMCIINGAVEDYDMEDYFEERLSEWIDDRVNEQLDVIIERKIEKFMSCFNLDDFVKLKLRDE